MPLFNNHGEVHSIGSKNLLFPGLLEQRPSFRVLETFRGRVQRAGVSVDVCPHGGSTAADHFDLGRTADLQEEKGHHGKHNDGEDPEHYRMGAGGGW